MHHKFRGLALHLWTVDTTQFEEALAAAKAGGFDAVELRRVDFMRARERGLSNTEVLGCVKSNGLPVSAVGCEYGWTFAARQDRERLFASLEEACERAVMLDCVTVMSGIGPGAASLEEGVYNIRHAGEIVARHGLRLALEYQFQHPIVSRLEILRELIAKAGQKSVGLLLDAYHLQRGGRPGRGFEDVPAAEIFYVQYSDVPDAPPNAVPPVDRLPPGQGVVRWSELFQLLGEKGYEGWVSYEAPNPAQWERPATDVAYEGAAATRRALEIAFG
ncbi:sugar phosphate isomerase/epimerase family protein [Reyranella sp.]|uniref:sugar phosphate isomerase/epimerase family protein n=1 Tax=Reyranella sp. TaxID=1929291 RepID=UPI003D0FA65B